MTSTARRALALVLTVAAAVGAGACGADDEPVATTSARPAPTETSPPQEPPGATTSATAPADPLAGADAEPVSAEPASDEVALLSDVRAARHEGYDRVVFEFRDRLPGYDVRYAERPIEQDGSGSTVAVRGDAVLEVRMQPAADADLSQPSAPQTYTGPARLQPDTDRIAEVVRAGGFEGVLTWAVGLRERGPFRVTTLDAPPRIVIDVPSAEPPAGTGGCGAAAGLAVEVVQGDVPCDAARSAVAGYDLQGPKVQEVGAFTCEGGEAATRPVVVTCVSEAGDVTGSTPG